MSGLAAAALVLASAAPVRLEIKKTGPSEYEIQAGFDTAASRSRVWRTLTDYDALPRIVPSIRVSRSREEDGRILVEQESVARYLMFRHTIRVRLVVHETPEARVHFSDTLGRCFERYEGDWAIVDRGDRRVVGYALSVKEGPGLPGFVPKGAVERSARSMLLDLKRALDQEGAASSSP